jgi:signal transduction histidine kinase
MSMKPPLNLLAGASMECTPEYERGLSTSRISLASDRRHLAIENANLQATNAQLWDQIKRFETMLEKFGAKIEIRLNPQLIAKLWSLEGSGRVVDAMTELNRISRDVHDNTRQTGAAVRRERANVPAPIRPVGGASHSASPNIADPNLDYQSYKRLMAENAKRQGREW